MIVVSYRKVNTSYDSLTSCNSFALNMRFTGDTNCNYFKIINISHVGVFRSKGEFHFLWAVGQHHPMVVRACKYIVQCSSRGRLNNLEGCINLKIKKIFIIKLVGSPEAINKGLMMWCLVKVWFVTFKSWMKKIALIKAKVIFTKNRVWFKHNVIQHCS